MVETGGVGGSNASPQTVLSRQRDLTALRAEALADKQTTVDNGPVAQRVEQQDKPTTQAEPRPKPVAPPVTPTEPPSQKIEEILVKAAEEGRETTRIRAEGESRNQPVAESEIGGTVNITT